MNDTATTQNQKPTPVANPTPLQLAIDLLERATAELGEAEDLLWTDERRPDVDHRETRKMLETIGGLLRQVKRNVGY